VTNIDKKKLGNKTESLLPQNSQYQVLQESPAQWHRFLSNLIKHQMKTLQNTV